jgi:hypothetical protein
MNAKLSARGNQNMQPTPADACPETQAQVNQVPEPSTWMLLLIAFGVAAIARRAGIDVTGRKRYTK